MTQRFEAHMSDADALMWLIEKDPVLRSTIVAVAILDSPPDIGALRARFADASCAIPRLRQRVLSPPMRLGPPRWAHEPNFDIDFHVRHLHLPAPGSERQLFDAVAPIAQASFDRARPLWECTVFDGLAPDPASSGTATRSAVVLKVHHSVTDGVGGIELLTHLVDFERDVAPRSKTPLSPPSEPLDALDLVLESAAHTARRLLGIARRVPASAWNVLDAARRDPAGTAVQAAATLQSIGKIVAPATAPLSPLLLERSLGRRLDAFDVPLDDLKRAAKMAEGSVNDAFVAGVVGGLDRYHRRYGAPAGELRVTMPINLRRDGDAAGGNQFAPARFAVPLDIADPIERMRALGALVRTWRMEPALGFTGALAGVLNRLPTSTTTALFGGMLKCVDFVTSNVPGAPVPVFLAGGRVERFYAFGPPSGAALNVTLLSHVDACCVGVVTDTAAVPDPDALVSDLRAGFDEIVAVGT